MGLGSVFRKFVGDSTGNLAGGVADAVDRFVETPEERKAADLLKMKMMQEPDKWQIEVNKIEAAHRTLFVAGWRPAIGWICAFSLAWGWGIAPVTEVVLGVCGIYVSIPQVRVAEAISLVMALLGMSAIRSYEKQHGLSH